MILLVEDNKMNQLVGSKVLEKLGYGFDIANHGGEAVERRRRRHATTRSSWTARCPRWTATRPPPRSAGIEGSDAAHPDHRHDRGRHGGRPRDAAWPPAWTTTSPSRSGSRRSLPCSSAGSPGAVPDGRAGASAHASRRSGRRAARSPRPVPDRAPAQPRRRGGCGARRDRRRVPRPDRRGPRRARPGRRRGRHAARSNGRPTR